MIPVFQDRTVNFHGYGNCVNACVASILERPLRDVAKIYPRCEGSWHAQWNVWYRSQGYRLVFYGKNNPPKGYSIAMVFTDRIYPEGHPKAGKHIAHAVVVYGDIIVHDPFPGGSNIKTVKYYEALEPLSEAEHELHVMRSRMGFCLHGYLSTCDVCEK